MPSTARRRSEQTPLLRVVQESDSEYLSEIEKFAGDLPDAFIRCRSLQHNWGPHSATRYRNAYVVKLRCGRCGTRKVQHLDSRGMLTGSTAYEYPEGYEHKGFGNLRGEGRGILRIASITRGKVIEVDEELD